MKRIIKTFFLFFGVALLLALPPLMTAYGGVGGQHDPIATQHNTIPLDVPYFDTLQDATRIINDWRALGSIAGIIAVLQLLIKILKLKPINDFMKVKKIKWIKPYISLVIGVLLVGLTAYSAGVNLSNSIVLGALFGISSTGWNEMLNKKNPKKRMR